MCFSNPVTWRCISTAALERARRYDGLAYGINRLSE
jgi:hypothetical protein